MFKSIIKLIRSITINSFIWVLAFILTEYLNTVEYQDILFILILIKQLTEGWLIGSKLNTK